MLLLGTILVWLAVTCVSASVLAYVYASGAATKSSDVASRFTRIGRWLGGFGVAYIAITKCMGDLLVRTVALVSSPLHLSPVTIVDFTYWLAWVAISVAALAFTFVFGNVTNALGIADRYTRVGRTLFGISVAAIIAAFVDLGVLLVTHRFDSLYVYEHSARGMASLYWFPSMWAGQEGSFLLWAFWTGIVGLVLACTAGKAERRVMPIYSLILVFLTGMMVLRSPFLPNTIVPTPAEGLGLNPNLENPWMVIHPPTLFLGFAALGAPFAYAVMALIWKDKSWLQRTLPWALFGFSFLGLAMMMGGYWAYEMLGWGGFWGWDPVENGPLIPWLCLMAFLHSAQVSRAGKGLTGTTYALALLPFLSALYETFLTRTGVLQDFSVHSFSTLGGDANKVLLWVMLGSMTASVGLLFARRQSLKSKSGTWDAPATREFAYTLAVVIIMVCAAISAAGMSAPLVSQIGVSLREWCFNHHIAAAFLPQHTSTVKEDFYNQANFPVGVLLAIGLGIGPHLAWRERGVTNANALGRCYAAAVIAAIGMVVIGRFYGFAVTGKILVAELLLFTASVFAILANGTLLVQRMRKTERSHVWTAGGLLAHVGAAVLLLGVVSLVCFTRKDIDRLLIQGTPEKVLNGAYTMTYLGQSGDYKTDAGNVLRFAVKSADGRESFVAKMPFALRAIEGGDKKIIAHPAIVNHVGGDLYLALKDGPDEVYKRPRFPKTIGMGETVTIGEYTVTLDHFERDRASAALAMQAKSRNDMPERFPITAILRVKYHGKDYVVAPNNIWLRATPEAPDTPETALPGGWLVSFQKMEAGSADLNTPNATPGVMSAELIFRQDTGPPTEAFEVDVTTRPMVNLVWLGTLILVAGGLLSMRGRIAQLRAMPDDEPDETVLPVGKNGRGKQRAKSANTRSDKQELTGAGGKRR